MLITTNALAQGVCLRHLHSFSLSVPLDYSVVEERIENISRKSKHNNIINIEKYLLGSGPYKLGKSSFHTSTSFQRSIEAYMSFAVALPREPRVEHNFPCCG